MGETESLLELGTLHCIDGSPEAVSFYDRAGQIYSDLGDLRGEGEARGIAAEYLVELKRYDEARQQVLRAIECKKSCGHAAQPWTSFAVLEDLERASGNPRAAESARDAAVAAFLAYRRAGGESHSPMILAPGSESRGLSANEMRPR